MCPPRRSRLPTPLAVGDTVCISSGSSHESGEIVDLHSKMAIVRFVPLSNPFSQVEHQPIYHATIEIQGAVHDCVRWNRRFYTQDYEYRFVDQSALTPARPENLSVDVTASSDSEIAASKQESISPVSQFSASVNSSGSPPFPECPEANQVLAVNPEFDVAQIHDPKLETPFEEERQDSTAENEEQTWQSESPTARVAESNQGIEGSGTLEREEAPSFMSSEEREISDTERVLSSMRIETSLRFEESPTEVMQPDGDPVFVPEEMTTPNRKSNPSKYSGLFKPRGQRRAGPNAVNDQQKAMVHARLAEFGQPGRVRFDDP
jgi:hypothetical protein